MLRGNSSTVEQIMQKAKSRQHTQAKVNFRNMGLSDMVGLETTFKQSCGKVAGSNPVCSILKEGW